VTSPLRQGRDGVTLALRVTPKSSRDAVTGLHVAADGTAALALKVTAPPDKGKANKAVIALLAETFGLPKSAFTLLSGETDRNKVVFVAGNLPDLEAVITSYRNLTDRN
jgi:uncharacterized protein (TIGR00251 family)